MLKLFALLCVLSVCWGLENPVEIDGIYHLVYSWPTHKKDRPNCTKLLYKKSVPDAPVFCQCRNGNSAVYSVHVEIVDLKFDVITKITDCVQELSDSISDECTCSPGGKARDVMIRIDDNYMLHYVQFDQTLFLLSKELPKTERRQEITDLVTKLINIEGQLLCQ